MKRLLSLLVGEYQNFINIEEIEFLKKCNNECKIGWIQSLYHIIHNNNNNNNDNNNNVLIGIFRICNLFMATLYERKKSWLNTDHSDVPRVNSFQPSNDQLCNTPSLQSLRPPSPKKFDIWNSLGHDFQNYGTHLGNFFLSHTLV